jgi:hypothetical protein
MDMPQIVQPRMRKQLTGATLAHGHVIRPDQIPDQRRHGIGAGRSDRATAWQRQRPGQEALAADTATWLRDEEVRARGPRTRSGRQGSVARLEE